MKIRTYISLLASAAVFVGCAEADKVVEFGTDSDLFELGPEGGRRKIEISSEDKWIATSNEPWITVSPANGRGSVTCELIIDSALKDSPRSGIVRIQNQNSWDEHEITIEQKGFDYAIKLKEQEVEIENFASYDDRYFEVKVNTNVDFEIEVPDAAQSWLKYETPKVVLDRGIRPRDITVRFNWGINSQPNERPATVKFVPKSSVTLTQQDNLAVTQKAAEAIPENTRKGDSIALLAISRSLNVWAEWNSGEKMDSWDGVQLWEEGMPGYTAAKEGRVRSARFFIFDTKEGLPFEVQYLTAAEKLSFFSNSNSHMRSLNTGEYINKLTQLKYLEISAYGLTELHPGFTALVNLEGLNISSNNFRKIPDMLTPQNFPKLRSLDLRTNIRKTIYDLSNMLPGDDIGGFYDEKDREGLPARLFTWGLDTLRLSMNYFQGALPQMDGPEYPKYTQQEVDQSDSLPQILVGKAKIMPKAGRLSINLNRLTGNVPDWLLYHPMLNFWDPMTLIFTQEGKDESGKSAGFDNAPQNMDYYYTAYPKKKKPSTDITDDDE